VFVFEDGAVLSGSIDGQGGADTADLSAHDATVSFDVSGSDSGQITVDAGGGAEEVASFAFLSIELRLGPPPIPEPQATISNRLVFYNRSAWDGNDAGANAADDAAIATDKSALLAGSKATFANYTSYSRGLNGIMVDIANLAGTPQLGDFEFRVGNDANPGGWSAAPAPTGITVRQGAGTADRIA
jgi:hypothetical protein